MKYILLLCVLSGCYVGPSAPQYHEEYSCSSYLWCDGIEYVEYFDICATDIEAYQVEEDEYIICVEDAYYDCFRYECSADCYPTGHRC
jgi:hypothetical protein